MIEPRPHSLAEIARCCRNARRPPASSNAHLGSFASPGRHMRALLLVESPAQFRERNRFVTANALSVA